MSLLLVTIFIQLVTHGIDAVDVICDIVIGGGNTGALSAGVFIMIYVHWNFVALHLYHEQQSLSRKLRQKPIQASKFVYWNQLIGMVDK